MKHFKTTLLVAATSALVTACGGGTGPTADTTPKVTISSVKVFGDSLQDSGTFGYKFTVQTGASAVVYPERVAAAYGQTLCPYYAPTSADSFVPSPTTGCTNFAIGGGVINPASVANPTTNEKNIRLQLAEAAAKFGSYSASDLLIIDGGANDAAALIGAYLNIPNDGGASYVGLLGTLQVQPTGNTAAALGAAGATYMTALADAFYASIQAQALGKGATHIVLMNVPGITHTPRFQMVLAAVGAASGATAAAQSAALFDGWVQAFNTELAAKFAGESRVVLVDFYSNFNSEIATPAQYSLTNVTTPACPITGQDSSGLPTYTFPTCTATALSAAPPSGVTDPNWWKSYGFADSFHPTPYGHQLVAQLISRSLAQQGWE